MLKVKTLTNDRHMTWTLLTSVVLFYALLILVNVPAPLLGLKFESDPAPRLWYQPPGYVIPIVWFVLFTLMGVARYQLLQTPQPQLQGWLFGLAFLCATYAYFTLGLAKLTHISALWFGLLGNVAVILAAWVV
jgi:tryptophan-rich sensory protein